MGKIVEYTRDNLLFSTNKEMIDIIAVHHYLSEESYWAKGIPFERVELSIRNSLCAGIYDEGKQVAFARVITDCASFAYLCDVFVLKQYQGKGLGKWLLESIHSLPELQGLRRWMLATRDAHGLYRQFGWQHLQEEQVSRFMQLHNPDVYETARRI